MNTQYRHYRMIDIDWLGRQTINNLGGTTFAFIEHDDHALIGVAQCSQSDNFCRKKGRSIADLRLKVKPLKITLDELENVVKRPQNSKRDDVIAFVKRLDEFFGTSVSKFK